MRSRDGRGSLWPGSLCPEELCPLITHPTLPSDTCHSVLLRPLQALGCYRVNSTGSVWWLQAPHPLHAVALLIPSVLTSMCLSTVGAERSLSSLICH